MKNLNSTFSARAYVCSCGASFSISVGLVTTETGEDDNAREIIDPIAEFMIQPHQQPGHNLEIISNVEEGAMSHKWGKKKNV